jgi:SAM-dependent methyltransferase
MATETFEISIETAELYESKFVPAMFGEWAPHVVDIAGVSAGHAVLDVACGTGIVARAAADRVGTGGKVVGLDLNEAMLTVARRLRPDLNWRRGDAAELPFQDDSFDVVLCQSAMMFFPGPEQALREMGRVAKGDGTVAVQVWGQLESSTGYARFAEIVARHAGPEAVNLFSTYWIHGDLDRFLDLFERAGLEVIATRTRLGSARFPSIEEFVTTEIESTPLLERIDADIYRRIFDDAQEALSPYVTSSGNVAVPIQGHLVAARKTSNHPKN